jgi:hypothetical protein
MHRLLARCVVGQEEEPVVARYVELRWYLCAGLVLGSLFTAGARKAYDEFNRPRLNLVTPADYDKRNKDGVNSCLPVAGGKYICGPTLMEVFYCGELQGVIEGGNSESDVYKKAETLSLKYKCNDLNHLIFTLR